MAKQVQITLTDDLTGGEAAETVPFAIDGKSFEIDLNPKNAEAMRKVFGKYVEKARSAQRATRGPGRPKSNSSRAKPERDYDDDDLKSWAAENDIELGRGRRKPEIIAQYKTARGIAS